MNLSGYNGIGATSHSEGYYVIYIRHSVLNNLIGYRSMCLTTRHTSLIWLDKTITIIIRAKFMITRLIIVTHINVSATIDGLLQFCKDTVDGG